MRIIQTDKTVAAIGPYSQAVEDGGVVYLSGQIPVDPETGEVKTDIKEATRQSLTNLKNLLEASGSDLNHVMKVNLLFWTWVNLPTLTRFTRNFSPITSPQEAVSPCPPCRKMSSWKSKPSLA